MNNIFLGFSRSFIRILVKVKFIFVVLVVAVSLPCGINFGFLPSGQGVHKNSNSFQMPKIGSLKVFSKIGRRSSTSDISIMPQVDNFWKESAFKFSNGFLKIFFVSSAFAEEMGNQCSGNRASQTKQETDSEIVQYDLSSLVTGYIMGLLSTLTGMLIYYFCTQRQYHRIFKERSDYEIPVHTLVVCWARPGC